MATNGLQIKDHPVHPKIVLLPIAFWLATLVGDVAYLATGFAFWYDFAFVCLGVGILTGLVAAVAGAFDFFAIPKHTRARSVGRSHAWLNLGAWLLFAVNFVFRLDAAGGFIVPAPEALVGGTLWAAVALSAIGVALISVSGWLGGELVYVEGVGVSKRIEEAGLPTEEEAAEREERARWEPSQAPPPAAEEERRPGEEH
jgi:uncharacterized membrane protein